MKSHAPIRVLQLCSSNGFYGAERVVLLLASHLRQDGCEVTLGLFNAARPSQKDMLRNAEINRVPVLNVACAGRLNPITVARLVHFLRRSRIDVIHSHGYKANLYGLIAGRAAGCRVVATCHNWTETTAALARYARADKLLLRSFDSVVAVSETVASTLRRSGVSERLLRVIHNGVDTARFRSRTAERRSDGSGFTVGVLSRLSPEKGVDVLLQALPKVLESFPDLQCSVIGEGPERHALTTLAETLGIAAHLRLPGYTEDTAGFLAGCSIVVHPSRMEGMPLAVLEAMASGMPIVATRVGDIPKLLRDGLAGVLVPPENPEALANGIIRMLESRALRETCGAEAAAHAADFDAGMMAARYHQVYLPCPEPAAAPHALLQYE